MTRIGCTGHRGLPSETAALVDRQIREHPGRHLDQELVGLTNLADLLPFTESTPQSHMAASEVIVDRCEVLLAVWDGEPSRGYGGTADVVAYARKRETPVEVLWPEGATRD